MPKISVNLGGNANWEKQVLYDALLSKRTSEFYGVAAGVLKRFKKLITYVEVVKVVIGERSFNSFPMMDVTFVVVFSDPFKGGKIEAVSNFCYNHETGKPLGMGNQEKITDEIVFDHVFSKIAKEILERSKQTKELLKEIKTVFGEFKEVKADA